MKILPKSLHTVTVLVNIAKLSHESDTSQASSSCIAHALNTLGYDDAVFAINNPHAADPHGLATKALKLFIEWRGY